MYYVNPRVDFAFKKLFGSEENNDLLVSLINAILQLPDPVTEVTLQNPYNLVDYLAGKLSILDIKAKDQTGRRYNVEMQINDDQYYDKRAMYYWCRLLTEQLQAGEMYRKLNKTFSINILGFDFFTTSPAFHNRYRILNVETCKDDDKHTLLEIHYLELTKFNKDYAELTTALDRWISFLTRAHRLDKRDLPPTLAQDPAIVKAITAVGRMFNAEERKMYEVRAQAVTDEISRIDSALAKGLEQGKAEGQAELIVAMLKRGASTEQIAALTGLNKSVIAAYVTGA